MTAVYYLLGFVAIILLVAIAAALVKPTLFRKLLGKHSTRLKAPAIFFVLLLLAGGLLSATEPAGVKRSRIEKENRDAVQAQLIEKQKKVEEARLAQEQQTNVNDEKAADAKKKDEQAKVDASATAQRQAEEKAKKDAATQKAAAEEARSEATTQRETAEKAKKDAATQRAAATRNAPKPIIHQLWVALDKSAKTRKNMDISWNAQTKTARLSNFDDTSANGTQVVAASYRLFTRWGDRIENIPGVETIETNVSANFIDSYGNSNKENAVTIAMQTSDFRKFDWKNLDNRPIYNQLKSTELGYIRVHPGIAKKVDLNQVPLYFN